MTTKIFISHSSKTQKNLQLLQQVCSGLQQKGFDILVDRGGLLYAGVDWELRINEWIAECDAAVILFSTAAVQESDWVKKEAAILSWRRELQSDFTLIPVLLEGVSPESLKQGLYGVLRISKDQCIQGTSNAQQIVEKVSDGLGATPFSSSSPFGRLESVLVNILEKQADTKALKDAWNALDGDHKPEWQPNSARRFSNALTRYLLRDGQNALDTLQKTLDRIRPRVSKQSCEELLKYLACLWVSAEAAGGLLAAPYRGGIVGLNGNYLSDFTAKRYCERAWPMTDQWRFIPMNVTQRTFDAICDEIRISFRPRSSARIPDTVIDKRIQQYKMPVLVVIPSVSDQSQLPDAELLFKLKSHYPNLIFMIGIGEQVPQWVPEQIYILKPLLDPQIEVTQFFALTDIKDFIDNRLHGSF